MLKVDGAFDGLGIRFELAPPSGCGLRFIIGPCLRFLLWLSVPAALEFGSGFAGGGPDVTSVGGPRLVSGVAGFEPLPFGGQLPGESVGAGRPGFIMLDLGICELLQGVGFGLRGEPQGPAYVGWGAGLGAFPFEDPGFELTTVKAPDDVCFITNLKRSKYCLTHVLEFGVAAVRLERDGLVGVGDSGSFPVGGGQARAAGVFPA